VDIKVEGNVLTIKATLEAGTPSKSGKTMVVSTTSGFQKIAGTNLSVSLNVIKSR
jgi:hypothetical protein